MFEDDIRRIVSEVLDSKLEGFERRLKPRADASGGGAPHLRRRADIAAQLGVSEQLIKSLQAEGKLRKYWLGRVPMVDSDELVRVITKSSVEVSDDSDAAVDAWAESKLAVAK